MIIILITMDYNFFLYLELNLKNKSLNVFNQFDVVLL